MSGNASYGLFIPDPGTSNNLIQANFIGTDAAAMNALPNGYMGLGARAAPGIIWWAGPTRPRATSSPATVENGIGMGGPAAAAT